MKYECKHCGNIIEKKFGLLVCPNCKSKDFWIKGSASRITLKFAVIIFVVAIIFLFITIVFINPIIGSLIFFFQLILFLFFGPIILMTNLYKFKKYNDKSKQHLLSLEIKLYIIIFLAISLIVGFLISYWLMLWIVILIILIYLPIYKYRISRPNRKEIKSLVLYIVVGIPLYIILSFIILFMFLP